MIQEKARETGDLKDSGETQERKVNLGIEGHLENWELKETVELDRKALMGFQECLGHQGLQE